LPTQAPPRHGQGSSAPGCPHTPPRSPGSANRRRIERRRSQSQYPHLYFGGHETTANTLIWSLFLLSLSEEWRARLELEARAVLEGPVEDHAARLVETKAVIEEAMRLYPPVASMSRQAIGPDDLAGKRIRKNSLVIVSQWVLHRHRLLWDKPDCFDPRRFLPGSREKIDRFAYLPFGAGPRVCIGASFSLQEASDYPRPYRAVVFL